MSASSREACLWHVYGGVGDAVRMRFRLQICEPCSYNSSLFLTVAIYMFCLDYYEINAQLKSPAISPNYLRLSLCSLLQTI